MSRSVALVLAWLVAAGASLAVAWRGVAVVGDQVTEDRPAPLTAEELAAPGTTGTGPSSGSGSTATSGPASTGTGPSVTAAPPGGGAGQPASETRPYSLVGGTATLRFTPSGVTVVVATPNPGFELDVEGQNANGQRVEFESESHRSRLDAWWDGGPQQRIREEPGA